MEINLRFVVFFVMIFLYKIGVIKVLICYDIFINKKKFEVM